MANNQGYFDDGETSDEISISYRMMNQSQNQAEDDNDEGIIEYLDLDLETSNIHDSEEYYLQVAPTVSTKIPTLPSKPSSSVALKSKVVSRSKFPRRKTTTKSPADTENARISQNSCGPISDFDNSETAKVQAAVTVINARLADSAKSMNGHAEAKMAKDSSTKTALQNEPNNKSGSDGLDLFFQSMAQTVMTLPSEVQARIKMDICKVIASAEMKYSTPDAQEIIED